MITTIVVAFALTAMVRVTGTPFTHSFGRFDRIDIDVYRLGAQMWRNGGSLYASGSMPFTTDGIWLPFTYPPFAALSFLPFTVVPLVVAGSVMAVVTLAATVAGTAIVLRALQIGSTTNRRWLVPRGVDGRTVDQPVLDDPGFGQINVVLLVLVAYDLLVLGPRGSRWHGVPRRGRGRHQADAVGVRAVGLVVRRDGRAVLRAVATFAAAAVVALVWAPSDSVRYSEPHGLPHRPDRRPRGRDQPERQRDVDPAARVGWR
ncbi:MAG: glycosyltransferase family 87 protein [Gordonia paraffinivorans]